MKKIIILLMLNFSACAMNFDWRVEKKPVNKPINLAYNLEAANFEPSLESGNLEIKESGKSQNNYYRCTFDKCYRSFLTEQGFKEHNASHILKDLKKANNINSLIFNSSNYSNNFDNSNNASNFSEGNDLDIINIYEPPTKRIRLDDSLSEQDDNMLCENAINSASNNSINNSGNNSSAVIPTVNFANNSFSPEVNNNLGKNNLSNTNNLHNQDITLAINNLIKTIKAENERSSDSQSIYSCLHCESNFFKRQDLTNHLRDIHNLKIYVCGIGNCKKSYTSKPILREHISLEHGEKPYKCQIPFCNYAFKSLSLLKRHSGVHNKPVSCQECGTELASNYTLKTHMKNFHGV